MLNGKVAPPRSSFLEHFLRLNGLDAAGFAAWEFLPGMRFGEREAWWRGGAPRDAPHEGVDLRGFRGPDGGSARLVPGMRVPALWAGIVAAMVPDFLGRSVFVAHDRCDSGGRRLHSVYGHLDPRPGLAPGGALREGEEVGTVADPAARSSPVPPHLHLTVALIAGGGEGAGLGWAALRDPARAVLLDPLPHLCATMRPR
jgi:murein DD-endopeptidase MepM/ murein hydrolase activator NlpD